MQTNKVLLVLDWSNLMFRSLFMNSLYGKVGNYDRIEDMQSFIYKFAIDVCSLINIFKPTNIIIATDAQHPWRKQILPEEVGYKSNRSKNGNFNWDNIFKCSDDLLHLLTKKGLHVAQVEYGEADDIVAMCTELVKYEYLEYNTVIVSADADLRQLISFDKDTHQYCVVYNTTGKGKGKANKRSIYATKEFIDWVNAEDQADIFFGTVDNKKTYIKNLLKQNTIIQLEETNPDEVLLHKIFCGDDGDCVPSMYHWYVSDKKQRITPSREQKIRNQIGINNVKDLCESIQLLPAAMEKVCKKEIDDIDIDERVQRQRVLVELNSKLFPEHIQEYKDTLNWMIKDTPEYNFWNFKAPDLFQGTKYENANKKKALEAEVFKDMDKYLKSNSLFN